jgi:hypothetical protein
MSNECTRKRTYVRSWNTPAQSETIDLTKRSVVHRNQTKVSKNSNLRRELDGAESGGQYVPKQFPSFSKVHSRMKIWISPPSHEHCIDQCREYCRAERRSNHSRQPITIYSIIAIHSTAVSSHTLTTPSSKSRSTGHLTHPHSRI